MENIIFKIGMSVMVGAVVAGAALALITPHSASATVGGPIYIDKISYSSSQGALYYLVIDGGGRGCMPYVKKMSLSTGAVTDALSCAEIEKMLYTPQASQNPQAQAAAQAAYEKARDAYFAPSLPLLDMIHLEKNAISIAVKLIQEQNLNMEPARYYSDFQATVFQDGVKKGGFMFQGCKKDQQNVFRGFAVPNSSKMVIMVSRIGNCFEAGYVDDNLFLIDGIRFRFLQGADDYRGQYTSNYQTPGIQTGNLVVAAGQTVGGTGTVGTSTPAATTTVPGTPNVSATSTSGAHSVSEKMTPMMWVLLAGVFIVGLLIGRFVMVRR